MAIIYTYPRKSNPNADDLLLISDKNDRNITKTISISSIQSLVSGVFGTGTAGKLASWSSSNMIEDYPYQLAPMLSFSDTINNATYTMLAYVNGARYGSVIKMTITGTATNTVASGSFDIMVNHSQDIHIKSLSGDYSDITLRITSNNNEDYSIEAKTNTVNPAPITVDVSIFPLSNEIVTRTTTLPPYTGQVYEHTATEGWRYGGTDGGIESSQVVIDGKLGIGLDSPSQPLSAPAGELQVAGINPNIYFTSNDTGQSDLYFGGVTTPTKGNIKYSDNADSFFFSVNTNTVALMLASNGNVGLGTNSPDAKLEVIGNYKQKAADANIGGFTISINSGTDAVDLNNYYSAPLTFSTNNAERMRVAGNGNVGIGQPNPNAQLDIKDTASQTAIRVINDTYNNYLLQKTRSDNTQILGIQEFGSNGGLSLVTGGSQRLNIDNVGNVGVGEDNPTARLHVSKDNVPDYGYVCKLTSTSSVSQAKVLTVQSSYNIPSGVPGDKMFVYSDGDLENINGAYGTIGSDERLKENIIDAKPKLNDILSLKVKNFNFIDNDKKQIGFIAQEFEKVFPSLVKSSDTRVYKTHDENGVLLEEQGELISGYEDTRSLRVGMEFAIITKVIQEQQEIIENLKQRIEQLEITK